MVAAVSHVQAKLNGLVRAESQNHNKDLNSSEE
jgi:hypothetical protein